MAVRCVSCGQAIADPSPEGCCPLCGVQQGVYRQCLVRLYVIAGALFMSALLYAVVVAVLARSGYRGSVSFGVELKTALIVVPGLGIAGVAVLQMALLRRGDPAGGQLAAIAMAAYAEGTAFVGLLSFLLTGDQRLARTLLLMAAVGFLSLAAKMPICVKHMTRKALEQGGS